MSNEETPSVDLKALDFTRLIADRAAIEPINPHRDVMALISGVVHTDPSRHVIVGYTDVSAADFWAKGHFPGFAVMPGVLMVEAAAQLANYYTCVQKIMPADRLVGLGGIEDTRFRELVRPGDRLVLVGVGQRLSARLTKFGVTGYVLRKGDYVIAFQTTVLGVPLGKREDLTGA